MENYREYQVTSGQSQMYSYEYFYDKLAAIKAGAKQLEVLDPTLDRIEYNGLKMNVITWVEEYNLNARKTESMARYKGQGLPDRLLIGDFIKEEVK